MIKSSLIALGAFFVVSMSVAQTSITTLKPADNSQSNSAPVNSAMKTSTADGQSNSASDMQITQQIRKSVIADKHLSTYAHNVKIVSVNGAITLNGVVRSEHEKQVVEMKAQAIAGNDHVTNDLTVAPKN